MCRYIIELSNDFLDYETLTLVYRESTNGAMSLKKIGTCKILFGMSKTIKREH